MSAHQGRPWDTDTGDVNHSVGFDFGEIDRHERGGPLTAELECDAVTVASEGLEKLLFWIWENGNFKSSFIKFVAMSAAMRPELLDDQSYLDLAKKLDCTKALMSYNVCQFQKLFGVHFRRSRTETQCKNFKAAQLKRVSFGNKKFLGSKKRK